MPADCSVVDGERSSERVHMCHGRRRRWLYTPHPLLLSLYSYYFISSVFQAPFFHLSFPCVVMLLCAKLSLCFVFIKLSPKLHVQSHFFNMFSLFHLLASFVFIFFNISLFLCTFLSFFLFSFLFILAYQRDPLCEDREEWCWSLCSLRHLHILTSLADDSQIIDQKISRSEVQRSMPPDWPRSETNQNSAKVQ